MIALLLVSFIAMAQQPHVINGRLQPEAGALESTFQRLVAAEPDVAWIGYAVPAVEGRQMCCSGDTWISDGVVITNGHPASCTLEPADRSAPRNGADVQMRNPVRLEGPETMTVVYRVQNRAVERIRFFSSDCDLDAGGRTIHWIDNVTGVESVKLLATFASRTERRGDKVGNAALAAIAMHRDATALDQLFRFAREDKSPHVRGEALFWLAQKAGKKAEAQITAAIENDPDTDVKKRAVFALSQLPKDEGVPLLIQVAKTNQNPAVRKQAMFWLGQSRDPRALAFFAEVLGK